MLVDRWGCQMSFSYENCEVCNVQTIESASFRGLSLCSECDKTHEVVDNWTLVKKVEKDKSKMKYSQFFENYKIIVDFNYLSYEWKISVEETGWKSEALTITKCERGVKVGTSRTLPVDGDDAFDLANMYQEALALSQTKNLTEDLLVELGYIIEDSATL